MPVPVSMRPRLPLVVLAACLAVFAARAYTSLRQESATWDETHYLGIGKYLLQHGRWDVPGSILHPPLSYYLQGLPLLFVETDPEPWRYPTRDHSDPQFLAAADLDRGRALLASSVNRDDRLLTMVRLTTVATGMLLVAFVFLWSHRLYGGLAAMLGVVFATCDPNLLAHARLVTPDIALTTFLLVGTYYFWRLLEERRTQLAWLAGAGLGLALLSKFNALIAAPVWIALAALSSATGKPVPWWRCALVAAVAVAMLWAGYRGDLTPYVQGIVFQQRHAAGGHPSFLFGERSTEGWWYYFLVAFLVKTPIGFMIMLGIAVMGVARAIAAGDSDGWLPEAFLLAPALAVLAFFSVERHGVGLRYLLPTYAFLYVFASRAAVSLAARPAGRVVLASLVAWQLGASWWIHPHYLAYFNEIVGGPSEGYRYLVDSNLDWGQDLKGLKRYMDEHGIARIGLSYFGSDDPARYGIAYDALPSYVLKGEPASAAALPADRFVAISATNLQGVYFKDRDLYATWRERRPEAVIGYSILLYRGVPDAN
jgi:4-amino-4-deoxy-L-arabinose transferase-like glycosyltransferase